MVTDGMPGTSMPAWRALPDKERSAVVAYIKTFAEAYKGAKLEPVAVPKEVASSEASLRRGKKMFDAFECVKCHGAAGRGDPAPGSDLKDDWGHPIRPANLHKPWNFRGGPERKDVVMRLLTGVAGTPMPAIADSVEDYRKSDEKDADVREASLWDLANYVRSLGPERVELGAPPVDPAGDGGRAGRSERGLLGEAAGGGVSPRRPGHRRPPELQSDRRHGHRAGGVH